MEATQPLTEEETQSSVHMMTDFLKYPLLVKVNFVTVSGLVIDDDADGVRLHL
jgi:hypothetical protein